MADLTWSTIKTLTFTSEIRFRFRLFIELEKRILKTSARHGTVSCSELKKFGEIGLFTCPRNISSAACSSPFRD
jgi:hypothetical protein